MAPPPHHRGAGSSNRGSSRPDFAYCVVWSPLPPITFVLPFIGHMGICDSVGVVHDFQGSYHVGQNGNAVMAFGPATRYLRMVGRGSNAAAAAPAVAVGDSDDGDALACAAAEEEQAERWDRGIRDADLVYNGRVHNICCDNCHSHVARALNSMPHGGSRWDMVKLCFLVFFRARFVSMGAVLYQFLPFAVLAVLAVVFARAA